MVTLTIQCSGLQEGFAAFPAEAFCAEDPRLSVSAPWGGELLAGIALRLEVEQTHSFHCSVPAGDWVPGFRLVEDFQASITIDAAPREGRAPVARRPRSCHAVPPARLPRRRVLRSSMRLRI